MRNFIDITGQTFGRLTVVGQAPRREGAKSRARVWLCRCECGTEKVVSGASLREGGTKSCGCISGRPRQEGGRTTHGKARTQAWRSWQSLRGNCKRRDGKGWAYYGGASVAVDPAWDSFERFLADVGEPPSPLHILARLDTSAGYCRANCAWLPRAGAGALRKSAVFVEHLGRRQTLSAWAREAGMKVQTLAGRLERGWTPRMAIETPVIRGNRR